MTPSGVCLVPHPVSLALALSCANCCEVSACDAETTGWDCHSPEMVIALNCGAAVQVVRGNSMIFSVVSCVGLMYLFFGTVISCVNCCEVSACDAETTGWDCHSPEMVIALNCGAAVQVVRGNSMIFSVVSCVGLMYLFFGTVISCVNCCEVSACDAETTGWDCHSPEMVIALSCGAAIYGCEKELNDFLSTLLHWPHVHVFWYCHFLCELLRSLSMRCRDGRMGLLSPTTPSDI